MTNQYKRPPLQLLVTIVDRDRVQKVSDVFTEHIVRLHYICLGRGTASSDILDLLGLGATEKAVVLCIEPRYKACSLLERISEKLCLSKPGRGIAFTIPLNGVSSSVLNILDKEVKEKIEKEVELQVENLVKEELKYSLIVAVVNQGFTEDVFSCAKLAGASGGTIINARKVAHEAAQKFFGISLNTEKEIVTILAANDRKNDIMKAISSHVGLTSDARGIVFSLPVADVEGISLGKESE